MSAAARGCSTTRRRAGAGPGWLDYRRDRYTAALALEYLVATRPRLLFVGLGDTDEYAHRDDYPRYLDSLRAADQFVGELMTTLARARASTARRPP